MFSCQLNSAISPGSEPFTTDISVHTPKQLFLETEFALRMQLYTTIQLKTWKLTFYTKNVPLLNEFSVFLSIQFNEKHRKRGCIQKFPDWPPGARTANGIALCH
jgi:hypothetical protein